MSDLSCKAPFESHEATSGLELSAWQREHSYSQAPLCSRLRGFARAQAPHMMPGIRGAAPGDEPLAGPDRAADGRIFAAEAMRYQGQSVLLYERQYTIECKTVSMGHRCDF